MLPQTDPTTPPRARRRWAAGAASALAAALLAGGGTAVALQAHSAPAQAPQAAEAAPAPDSEASLADLTSLDALGPDISAADSGPVPADNAAPAALVQPDAAASASASPGHAASAAKHPARMALRRALAVVIRQDGTPQYGEHAQAAARTVVNRHPAAFRHLPEKLRQDLWTLAGAAAGDEARDAQTIKDRALDGTYGDAVKKLAEAIQKAPAKASTPPNAQAPSTPAPSPSAGS